RPSQQRGAEVRRRRLPRLHSHRLVRPDDVARRLPQQPGSRARGAGALPGGPVLPAARDPLGRGRQAVRAVQPHPRDPPSADPSPPGVSAQPLWVFAYGSLMWNPGFAVRETKPARLHGFHRAFCIYSEHYRGTPQKPGLILGLLAGGSCRGLAHRLPARDYDAVRRYLWRREIENDGVYVEEVRPIHLADGHTVPALVYLADRAHRQFAGKLPLAKAL